MIFQRRYTRPTTLIARQGYSGYESTGATPTCDPNTQYFDSQYTQTCRAFADVGPPKADSGHWYDPFVSIFGGASSAYAAQQNAAAAAARAQQGGMPTWILPVAIGGVALVAVMLITRPRPTSNPGRRRRRRRNPAGLTKKGERMYRHIKKSYGGSGRAKEIAARTVYARAKRQKGLVRKR